MSLLLHEVNSESGSYEGTYCKFLHNQVAAEEEQVASLPLRQSYPPRQVTTVLSLLDKYTPFCSAPVLGSFITMHRRQPSAILSNRQIVHRTAQKKGN
jgi:hypothetical protein